ncbi:MAG: hypothetical protein G5703_10715 [Serratia symbiotica]|nr:hypothetical protein [Serratia symbiotica]
MINMVLSDSGVRDSICVPKIGINTVIEKYHYNPSES